MLSGSQDFVLTAKVTKNAKGAKEELKVCFSFAPFAFLASLAVSPVSAPQKAAESQATICTCLSTGSLSRFSRSSLFSSC